jgi:hypothetical protein
MHLSAFISIVPNLYYLLRLLQLLLLRLLLGFSLSHLLLSQQS